MITEVPDSIKYDKDIAPFIQRANELEEVNPIVSYYCKIYVLEHILERKLHKESKENEIFTINLLDLTESFKNEGDEATVKVLEDKTLAASVILSFTLNIFNSCLAELNEFQAIKKQLLVHKFKVCLYFFKLFELFRNEASVDYRKLTNGKCTSYDEFNGEFVKKHNKILKFNLGKLMRDEVEEKGGEAEEDELERELAQLSAGNGAVTDDLDVDMKDSESNNGDKKDISDLEESTTNDVGIVDSPSNDEDMGLPKPPLFIPDANEEDSTPNLPQTPTFIQDSESKADPVTDDSSDKDVSLPGVPHFSPETDLDDIKLPGAPKYLPDDDLSTINKTKSIKIFTPEEETTKKTQKQASESKTNPDPKPKPKPKAAIHAPHQDITKENIEIILDKQESIAKVQKHCKFAVSALNYEDLGTAEDELIKGLELLRMLKQENRD